MKITKSQLALAFLIAATPAAAEPSVLSSHEVRFDGISFTCGEVQEQGKSLRFLRAAPYKLNLPMYEPSPSDPAASGWLTAYRTICENARGRSQLAVAR